MYTYIDNKEHWILYYAEHDILKTFNIYVSEKWAIHCTIAFPSQQKDWRNSRVMMMSLPLQHLSGLVCV